MLTLQTNTWPIKVITSQKPDPTSYETILLPSEIWKVSNSLTLEELKGHWSLRLELKSLLTNFGSIFKIIIIILSYMYLLPLIIVSKLISKNFLCFCELQRSSVISLWNSWNSVLQCCIPQFFDKVRDLKGKIKYTFAGKRTRYHF